MFISFHPPNLVNLLPRLLAVTPRLIFKIKKEISNITPAYQIYMNQLIFNSDNFVSHCGLMSQLTMQIHHLPVVIIRINAVINVKTCAFRFHTCVWPSPAFLLFSAFTPIVETPEWVLDSFCGLMAIIKVGPVIS